MYQLDLAAEAPSHSSCTQYTILLYYQALYESPRGRPTTLAGPGSPFRHTRAHGIHIYTYINMKGHNNCAWLKVGELETCGKSCCKTYCKVHLARIRNGSKIPVPCRVCRKGVQSEIEVCRACGRDKLRHQQIALEKKTRRQFRLVLYELLVARNPI